MSWLVKMLFLMRLLCFITHLMKILVISNKQKPSMQVEFQIDSGTALGSTSRLTWKLNSDDSSLLVPAPSKYYIAIDRTIRIIKPSN